jgi:hypothetical protein
MLWNYRSSDQVQYSAVAFRTSYQAWWKGLYVVLLRSNKRSLSLLKFPYLSRQLFDNEVRLEKCQMHILCFFDYNSNKNSSGLFVLLFRYFPTESPPKLFIAVFILWYLALRHSCFHLAFISILCLPRLGFSAGHGWQPIGYEFLWCSRNTVVYLVTKLCDN